MDNGGISNGLKRDRTWIRSLHRPRMSKKRKIRAVDLFSGCGGMTLGLGEAARRHDVGLDVRLAVDIDPRACAVYKANFDRAGIVIADVGGFFPGKVGDASSSTERRVSNAVGNVDILLGGPPCEGHSDLNNHTRRRDPKNGLYLRMARAAEVLRPRVLVIENVPPVLWDSEGVVGACTEALLKCGYSVHGQVIDLTRVGVPQRRRRFILVAIANSEIDPGKILSELDTNGFAPRDVRWAIADLEKDSLPVGIDAPSQMSEMNRQRTDFLFDHDLHDLPNDQRPVCHQSEHSYKSMYGRLRWDRPAQTITTGFTSMGQGRYVHPSQRRTITPHEAARLQTFPDWFQWSPVAERRVAVSRLIGNAVPPLLMLRLGHALMPHLLT